ncbi:MAG: hypothetical protein RI897_1159 [Verrucomicrobiota bacterium]|jgi:elongation factor G
MTGNRTAVRNIGIAAHIDAGKTTLTERILFYAGLLHRIGEVHDGAAHMDYMQEEQAHGITITSAVTKARWKDHTIQVVDTPGHVDFTIEVERSMRVLDSCIVVLDAVRGVEPQTETVWRQRTKFDLPSLFFINKTDRLGASFDHAMETVRQRLGVTPVPVTIPLPEQRAVVDLIHKQLISFGGAHGEVIETTPCEGGCWQKVKAQRESLLLELAEHDDTLADEVLSGREPDPELVWSILARCTQARLVFPCFGGSALRNFGVQPLMDAVVRLLPAPLDRPPSRALRMDGTEEMVAMEDEGLVTALAFKVQRWDGRRHVFVRIYRGVVLPGSPVAFLNARGEVIKETVARIFDIDADRRVKMDQAAAGQIVLFAGLRYASTGDTLCDPGHLLQLERIEAREPVLSLAVEPRTTDQQDKFLEALERLQEEDPTLRLGENPDTGQRLLSGMGELHLQILVERLQHEYKLEVRTGRPAVAMRETITCAARGSALFHPPRDPANKSPELRAKVTASVEPCARGSGNKVQLEPAIIPAGSTLSDNQREAISNAIRDTLTTGPLDGARVQDLLVKVEEVELFGAASTLDALQAATSRAVNQALAAAGPALLQPIMSTEVIVPEENLGTVLGDLQSRHAVIHDTGKSSGLATIRCDAPLSRLLGYTTELRNMTQGRGNFSTQFLRFDIS